MGIYLVQTFRRPQKIQGDPMKKLPRLTLRESQIAKLLASGTPRKIIAGKLQISVSTVASHLERIRAKLEVASTFEAGCVFSRHRL